MRVSTSLLATGLAASVLAAPGAQRRSCSKPSAASSLAPVATPESSSAPSSVASSLPSPSSASSSVAAAQVSSSAAPSNVAAAVTTSSASSSSAATTASAAATSSASSGSGFKFFGASESGAEFGNTAIPGVYGTDFIFPDTSAIQTLMDLGMNTFRIPFLMERLAPSTMTATLDADYLANLTTVVKFVTGAGGYAVLDPHNYARYAGSIISSTADFGTFWTNLAGAFADDAKVVFDCNNEPHDMSTATQTAELMQACVDAVRGAGATSQYVFVEGTAYTGAWSWTTTSGNADNMGNLTDDAADAEGLLVYEMHQYLDSDSSGTSSTCVSSTIGQERVADATAWLKANGKLGVLGEFAGGVNADCETAVDGMLSYLQDNSDVWLGALWWGAGPWWGDYIFAMEPPSGAAYTAYKDILAKYVPT